MVAEAAVAVETVALVLVAAVVEQALVFDIAVEALVELVVVEVAAVVEHLWMVVPSMETELLLELSLVVVSQRQASIMLKQLQMYQHSLNMKRKSW